MMGRSTMRDRVIERAHHLLATHEPSPVKPETRETIKRVLAAAEERVKEPA